MDNGLAKKHGVLGYLRGLDVAPSQNSDFMSLMQRAIENGGNLLALLSNYNDGYVLANFGDNRELLASGEFSQEELDGFPGAKRVSDELKEMSAHEFTEDDLAFFPAAEDFKRMLICMLGLPSELPDLAGGSEDGADSDDLSICIR